MRPALRLFLVMGEAALMLTASYFTLILIVVRPLVPHVSVGVQAAAGVVVVIAPICFAALVDFQKASDLLRATRGPRCCDNIQPLYSRTVGYRPPALAQLSGATPVSPSEPNLVWSLFRVR